jgi:hypothetical protein
MECLWGLQVTRKKTVEFSFLDALAAQNTIHIRHHEFQHFNVGVFLQELFSSDLSATFITRSVVVLMVLVLI